MPQVYSHGFPLYWDVRLIVELSGEHPHLPFAELEAVGTVIDRRPQVAVVECPSPQTTRRLALAHAVLAYLGESAADRESFAAMLRDLGITAEGPFAARVRKMAGSSMETPVPDLERLIGSSIRGTVSLSNPSCEYRAILSNDRCYFGKVMLRIDRPSYDQRRPGSRAFFHPGVMMPRLARALVNISLIRPGEKLLDPFSGTGGIVLEASLVGAYGIGSDIDPCMAEREPEKCSWCRNCACRHQVPPVQGCEHRCRGDRSPVRTVGLDYCREPGRAVLFRPVRDQACSRTWEEGSGGHPQGYIR